MVRFGHQYLVPKRVARPYCGRIGPSKAEVKPVTFVFNPIDPDFLRDPYPTYRRMRDELPVYRHPAGFWVVSRYADVAGVLKDAETFSSAAMGGQQQMILVNGEQQPLGVGPSLLNVDPPVHTEMRGIVNRGFTPGRIEALRPRIEQLADALLESFEQRGACDLTTDFANPLPVSVILELLNLDPARRDEFKELSTALTVGMTSPATMGGANVMDNLVRFRACISEAVEDRRRHPGDDLISILVNAEAQGGVLDAETTIGFAGLLLIAGSETTTNLIGNATVSIAREPGLLERVRDDRSLVKPLLEESLRHDPPIQVLMRLTTRDTEIDGTEIPHGNMVMIALGSANRDETRFPDPDRFDLDRNTSGHLGFGFGNHFCLGASLARLEASVSMNGILDRLAKPRLATPTVEYHGSFLIRGPATLPIEFNIRAAA
jgi:cytochrome P450